ncbi:MFS transporter [Pseudonocardia eucalypti]|uniref:MFS transporter n=1 Tax=Pseudonocardia eucalypti TaxID=648755 RepID=A0ABP9R6Q2_9PSEU|nr:DHA2 family multidrug resistance protein-like MFS transporter [Pseudonocardia eucalypti]
MSEQITPARAGPREWLGLAVLALPTLLLALDQSVLFLAAPHLAADLRPTAGQMLWIMDSYGFMIAGFLVTMGTLGDRIGRRRLLMIGSAAFGAASVLAAYSASAEMLIATRALLGVAAATLMPATLALIRNMFAVAAQRALAVAVWMSCFSAGTALGPLVGGAVLEHFWWGAAFLMGVPVMVLLLVGAPALLPEYRDPTPGRLDLGSVALSLGAVLPVVYGLKEIAQGGSAPVALMMAAGGAAIGYWFVRRQRSLASPLLDLRLFAERKVGAALVVIMLGMVAVGGMFLVFTQYVQLVLGLSPWLSGLAMVPSALAMIAGTMLAPWLARRTSAGTAIGAGLVVSAAGFGSLALAGPGTGLVPVLAGLTVAFLGAGPFGALGIGLVVESARPERAGAASSLSETSGEFGVAVGLALLGSVAAAVYRSRLEVTRPPGTPAEAAATAREGLAAIAEPGPLLDAARAAFTEGLNAVSVVAAALVLLLAALAMLRLRD